MIRSATADDRETFSVLWAEQIRDAHKAGSDTLPTLRNLSVYLTIFDAYMAGRMTGGAVIADVEDEPVGVLMGGEFMRGQPVESDYGRIATMWGLYVRESHRSSGVVLELADAGADLARDLGFDTMVTTIPLANQASMKAADKVGLKMDSMNAMLRLRG